ncbi:MAG: class I tRNA ligase family protein, partial [Desulfobacteraceae bacterium]
FGTDAFRFTLAALAAQGRDIKLSEERILGYRHFVNKIWNAARFVMMNLNSDGNVKEKDSVYSLPDRWILTRLSQVTEEITQALEAFHFNEAAGLCYHFVWHEFCDWYLEMAKQRLYGKDRIMKESARGVVQEVLMAVLKLLHPFMPFMTEEIWEKLPRTEGSIMVAQFPEASDFIRDENAVKEMNLLMGAITGIRNIRGEMNIPPSMKVNIIIDVAVNDEADLLNNNLSHIKTLAKVEEASIATGAPRPEASATAVFGQNQVYVLLKGILDFEEEIKRLRKQIEKIEKDIEVSNRKLSNHGFLEKAPSEIVNEVREKVETLTLKQEKLNQNLGFFETIGG